MFELEQGLRDSGWSEAAEWLMEKGLISVGVVDAQGSPVLVIEPDEVKTLGSRLSELLAIEAIKTLLEFAADLKALAGFVSECSGAGLCVLRFGC